MLRQRGGEQPLQACRLSTPAYNAGGFRVGFSPTRHPPLHTTSLKKTPGVQCGGEGGEKTKKTYPRVCGQHRFIKSMDTFERATNRGTRFGAARHTAVVRALCRGTDAMRTMPPLTQTSTAPHRTTLQTPEPTATWMGKSGGFKSLDHHWTDAKFATAGDSVDLWDHSRAEPTLSYQWGADSNNCVR